MQSIKRGALMLVFAASFSLPALAADDAPVVINLPAATTASDEQAAPKLEDLSSQGPAKERCHMGMPMGGMGGMAGDPSHCNMGKGMGMGDMKGKCNMPDCDMSKCDMDHCRQPGMGMGHGKSCHEQGHENELEQRVEALEKRIDMLQMMIKMMVNN